MINARSWVAVVALATSFIATHWPRLKLPDPMMGGDQAIHLATFLAVGLAVWWARWFATPGRLFAAVLAWSALDESLQAVPWIHRYATADDFLANAAGVTCAWLIARKHGREGGVPARRLPNAIPALLSSCMLGVVAGSVAIMVLQPFMPEGARLRVAPSAIFGAIAGGVIAFEMMRSAGCRKIVAMEAMGGSAPGAVPAVAERFAQAARELALGACAMTISVGIAVFGTWIDAWERFDVDPDLVVASLVPLVLAPALGWLAGGRAGREAARD